MNFVAGVRREDKNEWERRVPITPDHVRQLRKKHNITTILQSSNIRIFPDNDYISSGAIIKEDLSSSNVIFGIKEIPLDLFVQQCTYVFFPHVIKGQKQNMPMLKKMMELGCNLIDYEKITDSNNRRLIFFGHHAGIAGMIDSLWAFGQRIKLEGYDSPLSEIKQTIQYPDLENAKSNLKEIGAKIRKYGIPKTLSPIVIGIVGYGNVSLGAQEILRSLPIEEISPDQLKEIHNNHSRNLIYKVIFKEQNIVEPTSPNAVFDLQTYYDKPYLFKGTFREYLPYLSIVMNCIYWDEKYPRFLTKNYFKKNYSKDIKLKVVGDISVDINGAVEFTEKITTPDNPVFIYNPINGKIKDGFIGNGIAVVAVDNLPCELPKESSIEFSNSLINLIPLIVKTDYSVEFEKLDLPPEVKKAVILYHGELTPNYLYINKYL
jgi:alpha-aminoadipic semialdehyde synthase